MHTTDPIKSAILQADSQDHTGYESVPDSDLSSMSTEDAARLLDTSTRMVRKLLDKGSLKGFRLGRHWRISRGELARFQREGGAQ